MPKNTTHRNNKPTQQADTTSRHNPVFTPRREYSRSKLLKRNNLQNLFCVAKVHGYFHAVPFLCLCTRYMGISIQLRYLSRPILLPVLSLFGKYISVFGVQEPFMTFRHCACQNNSTNHLLCKICLFFVAKITPNTKILARNSLFLERVLCYNARLISYESWFLKDAIIYALQ